MTDNKRFKRFSEYLESAGNRLHLDIRAADDGAPALLFIPGTGAHAGYYAPFLDALAAQGFTVAGLDYQGHGRSEGKRGDFTFGGLLDDVNAAVAHVRERFGERIGAIGSSQGGLLTLYAAAGNGDIKSAVCHNAALLARDGIECTRAPRFFRATMPFMKLLGALMPGLRLPTWTYLDVNDVFRDAENRAAYYADPLTVKRYTLRAILSLAAAVPPAPLSEIRRPVMIITGDSDNVIPLAVARRVYEDLSEPKRLEVIEGALHMLFLEYLEESLGPIARWFADTL